MSRVNTRTDSIGPTLTAQIQLVLGTSACRMWPVPVPRTVGTRNDPPFRAGRSTHPVEGDLLRLLDLDLDVHAGRQLEALQRVHGLRRRLEDVEQALVDPHLEVLAAVLVLVR